MDDCEITDHQIEKHHLTEKQVPLSVRWETKDVRHDLNREFGFNEAESSIALSLTSEFRGRGRYTSYSLHAEWYSRHKDRILSYRKVKAAFEGFEQAGLIENHKQKPGKLGLQSYARAKIELVERVELVFSPEKRLIIIEPREPIIIRDKDGVPTHFDENRETRRMRRELEALNECTRATDIKGPGSVISGLFSGPLSRIFNLSRDRCGRLYVQGGGIQSMTKAARKQITIDGEPVNEIDYKNLHPVMLYSEAGLKAPPDCYDIHGWVRELRPLIKVALLIMINAKTKNTARCAIVNHKTMELVCEKGSPKAFWTADQLMDDVAKFHHAISESFYSDAGARLMRRDSDIAAAVMLDMMSHGVCVQCIHDSFLVQVSKSHLLEESMKRAAYEGGLKTIELKYA